MSIAELLSSSVLSMHAQLLLALRVRWVLAALQNVFHAVVGDALQWLDQLVTRYQESPVLVLFV